jgi:hypothetical protein
MEKRTTAELLAWIEQHQPVTREKLLGAFEDMDYEQLQGWLSELQRKRKHTTPPSNPPGIDANRRPEGMHAP